MDKILLIQSEIGVLVKTETNPFFKSKYMDINGLLEQLLPLLEKHKLVVIQPLTNLINNELGNTPALATIIYDEGKEILNQAVPLPDLQDPQKMGSAITYYRRYALQSLFLLRAEDDDGNKGSEKVVEVTPLSARKNAEEAINSANNLDVLMEIELKIKKSKVLTSKDKEELSFIANERREQFDPTK